MELPPGIINTCPADTLAPPASHLFFTLINTLLASQCALGPEGRYPPDYGNALHDGDEFDFIIVGSGSAGAVVANRLSQVKDWKVLLLEAGSYPSAISEIPQLYYSLQHTPEDWQPQMEPSKTCCLGLKDKKCLFPRGKVLGGSSTLNAMLYVRGNSKDYNGWAEAGNIGWDYESVLKQYNKFEGCQDPNCPLLYGKNGELELTRYKYQEPMRDILEDAYKELGYYQEFSEEKPIGLWDHFVSINKGTRFSTAKSFIERIKDRKNLYVALNAQVSKLIVNKLDKTVLGVELKINETTLKIKAKKEVILSAGTVNSPQILMNSGIGPKDHLDSLGIDRVTNLRVGENLQNHVTFALVINIDKSVVKSKSSSDKLDDTYQYFMHKNGPLSTVGLLNFVGFINTRNSSIFPDLQLFHIVIGSNDPHSLSAIQHSLNFPDELLKIFQEHNKHNSILLLTATVINPKSRGKILLRSTDPFDKPMIFPNYLSDENNEDLELLLTGIKLLKKLLHTKPFTEYKARLVEYTLPNCKEYDFDTDEFWRCAIRNVGNHLSHLVGTCKMGPEDDPSAVVDPRLRVHGIKGVRVIDGSVMPTITSGNTNAPIIMIGEKGAELIKEDWLGYVRDES
ncbi:hypothetical protein ILUMI_24238 [Ignelater luminosus]|uniref:Glucose-methanol-choline oxidoreductase N-terminal domain-containing protein n=1 Tax=Ignelater luminosus TaxID=2038154 RepID=A0A8K0G0V0_IGNLU|nr:hypothetical protein ILUMI_24238 [Ignelater luminosus]